MPTSSKHLDDDQVPSSPPLPPSALIFEPGTHSNEYEDTYVTRPNRYFGPDSTWLSWTKTDRAVVESLEHSRSENLSMHLLNAHTLKRRLQYEGTRSRGSRKGKRRATSSSNDDDRAMDPIRVTKNWTAWPLPPDQVPREIIGQEADSDNVYGAIQKPSGELEEQLLAYVTQAARKRWKGREWATGSNDWVDEQGVQTTVPEDTKPSVAELDVAETLTSESEAEEGMIVSQVRLVDADDSALQGSKPNLEVQSQSDDRDHAPTPIADDEEARQYLLPSIRQTLSQLDDLLIALHKSRTIYSSSGWRYPDKDHPEENVESGTPSRSMPRKRRHSRSRSRLRSHASVPSDKSESEQERTRPRKRLGLRDWSDVLGMASLTGWDSQIVGRASEKCAILFEENMMFRRFQEGAADDRVPRWEELYAYEDSAESDAMLEDADATNKTLVRASKPCKRCAETKSKCQPDLFAEPGSQSCQRCNIDHEECSGITLRSAPKQFRCPYKHCERHDDPFTKISSFQRHLDEVHKLEHIVQPSSPAPASSASEGYLSGGVDHYFCYVKDCSRKFQGFTEGARLYRHIRSMHPEVDVEEVKRLETHRRGERRGRWRNEHRRSEVARQARSKSLGRSSSPPTQKKLDTDEDEEASE